MTIKKTRSVIRSLDPRTFKFAKRHGSARFWNARREFDKEHLEGLMKSIQEDGLLSNPVVRAVDNEYQIVCGDCRTKAILRLLDDNPQCYDQRTATLKPARKIYHKIDVKVLVNCSDAEASRYNVLENMERKNLTDIEWMTYCIELDSLKNSDGTNVYTREQIGEIVKKSQTWVSQTISLYDLSDKVKEKLADGSIPRSVALSLLKAKPEYVDQVIEYAETLAEETRLANLRRAEHDVGSLRERLDEARNKLQLSKMSGLSVDETVSRIAARKLDKQLNEAESRQETAQTRKPRVTGDHIQSATDAITGARKGKRTGLSHKTIRDLLAELDELRSESGDILHPTTGTPYDNRDLELLQRTLQMVLGTIPERKPLDLLNEFYINENKSGWD